MTSMMMRTSVFVTAQSCNVQAYERLLYYKSWLNLHISSAGLDHKIFVFRSQSNLEMSSVVDTATMPTSEAATGSLPMRKRKGVEGETEERSTKRLKRGLLSGARVIRLEQNRKAARESRRRKKSMIEELQRSVIFFSRTNGTIKQQNEELARLVLQAQVQVGVIENQKKGENTTTAAEPSVKTATVKTEDQKPRAEQYRAESVVTQAMYESKGFSSAAPKSAAHSANATCSPTPAQATSSPSATVPSGQCVPSMQPGATMQAMANFQHAAAAAMQAATQGMQGNVGLSMGALANPPPAPNAQQVFNDTMAAIAMQQAAAAVTGQQFLNNPFMAPMLAWQNHQAAMAVAPISQKPGQGLSANTSQIPTSQL